MTAAYFTWLGPPQSKNKQVEGVGAARPDLFGLLRTSSARFSQETGTPPTFTLCCLKKYEARFRSELPNYINTLALEDDFGTQSFKSMVMTRPDLSNIALCVDYITRSILGVQGSAYADDALPYAKLAFVKDIWSLYCVWKYGGYHIDAGCFPDSKYGGTVHLPAPDNFAVPVVSPPGKVPFHAQVAFTGQAQAATLCGGWASMNGAIAQATLGLNVGPKGTGVSSLNRQIDVWMLRAPQGDPQLELALKFYISAWFAMRDADQLNSQSYRELAVAAVATGITHSDMTTSLPGDGWKSHVIESNNGDVPSLGLRKVGFQSHAP